jgi:hypothetical protein
MRGYPAEKISILTTYNGQKALIRDVVERRCAGHPAFGRPLKVSSLLLPVCIVSAAPCNKDAYARCRVAAHARGYLRPTFPYKSRNAQG